MLRRSGFTLIELMIIVVIIGILAIAILSVINIDEMFEETLARRDAEMIQKAAEDYALDHKGEFPPHTIALSGYLPSDVYKLGKLWLLENHFTGRYFLPVDGMASTPGEIGYTAWFGQGNRVVDYQITLYGRSQDEGDNGIILTLRHSDPLAN